MIRWSQRGYAMVSAAVIFILVGLALILFLSGLNVQENSASVSSQLAMQAHYLALSGIDWALEYARLNDPADTLLHYNGAEIAIETEYQGGDIWTLSSTGRISDYERRLSLSIFVRQTSFFPDTSMVDRVTNTPGVRDTVELSYPDYIRTFIAEGNPNVNFSQRSFNVIGWQNNAFEESRMLIRFDLTKVEYRSSLDTALLIMSKVPSFPPRSHDISIHNILTDWVPGEASWNDKRDGLVWNTGGGDHDPLPVSVTTVRDGGPVSWDVTASVRSMLKGTLPNNGWLLKDPSPSAFTFSKFANPIPPKLLLYFDGEPGVLIIDSEQYLNGNMFVRDSIFVMDANTVGQSPGAATYFWVTDVDTVYGYPHWGPAFEYPSLGISYPAISDTVGSMIYTAANIFSYLGNRFIIFSAPPSLDLSVFQSSTIYVRESIQFNNTVIADQPYETPGFVVSAGNVEINNASIGKNIIILAQGDVTVNGSVIGSDFREGEEKTVNLIWSEAGNLHIGSGSVLYANAVANGGNGFLESTMYGGLFVRDTVTFYSPDMYLEGGFWVGKVRNNRMNAGHIKITHGIPDVFIDLPRLIKIVENIH